MVEIRNSCRLPYLDHAIFPPSKIKLALGRFVSKFWNESFGKKSRFRAAVSGRDTGLFLRWGGIRTSEEIMPVWYLSIDDFFKILELYESINSFFEFWLVEGLDSRLLLGETDVQSEFVPCSRYDQPFVFSSQYFHVILNIIESMSHKYESYVHNKAYCTLDIQKWRIKKSNSFYALWLAYWHLALIGSLIRLVSGRPLQ